jgi:hypothetical protein
VRGASPGTIWHDQVAASRGIFKRATGFLAWYDRWLDEAIDGVRRGILFSQE